MASNRTQNHSLPYVALLAVALVPLSGCFGPTRGEAGVVEVAYDEGVFGCLFGCDAHEPMAVGATAFVDVRNPEDYPTFVVSSDRPSTLEFIQDAPGDTSIRLDAHIVGQANMVFEEAESGELIDRVLFDVNNVARMELVSPGIMTRYLIMVGGADTIQVDLFDSRGEELKGYGGVDYVLSGGISEAEVTLTSAIVNAVRTFFAGTNEHADIDANALGAGQIDVVALSGVTLTIPVEVVDASAVATVTVESDTAEPGGSIFIDASAFASDGEEIHSPECVWNVVPTSGTVVIDSMGRDSISLTADAEATATVTCTIGSAASSGVAEFRPAA